MQRDNLDRYTVRVPRGDTISNAVADHRERTGHGGCVFVVFGQSTQGAADQYVVAT
jgi:hypothetical protein